jgi:Phage integrase, N-terminal SAM-like domain
LQAAYRYYRPRSLGLSGAVRALRRFYVERGTIPEGQGPAPSPVEIELNAFAEYLRESRGLAAATVLGHTRQLRAFLHFLRVDQDPGCLRQLELGHIEGFLRWSARTNNRFSLQHIVATVRAYLRWQYAEGKLSRTLHRQIDTPRVYRLERLPRALAWTQVQALLDSIDRSEPFGLRDFTVLSSRRTWSKADEPIQGSWLDKCNLIPGDPWQPAIEDALQECESCAVFIGPEGLGPWQRKEMSVAINRRVRESVYHEEDPNYKPANHGTKPQQTDPIHHDPRRQRSYSCYRHCKFCF